MKIKAVLSDFDGTLVDSKERYSPKIKGLIKKLRGLGIRFSFATGRLYSGKVQQVEKELDIKGIHIFHGGGKIFDTVNNKILLFKSISKTSVDSISKYLIKNKVFFALETEKDIFMSPKIKKTRYLQNINVRPVIEYNHRDSVVKILVFVKHNFFKENQLDFHTKNIQKIVKDIEIIKFQFGDYFGVDITALEATKHTAVLEYCKLLGYKQDNIVAIGDGYNDYHLFTAAGYKIAMGNSPKELKEVADLIVSHVDQGGMDEALNHIINMVK